MYAYNMNSNIYYTNNIKMPTQVADITSWHYQRNLIEGSTDKDQCLKLVQEVGEMSDNICQGKSPIDDIGDCMVVLINIAERNGLTIEQCLAHAWNDIKDRKGKMVDGIFVKEADYTDKPTKKRAAAPVRVYPKTTEM